MKLKFYSLILQKYSNTKFNQNPSNGGELLQADGRRDRRTELKKLTDLI